MAAISPIGNVYTKNDIMGRSKNTVGEVQPVESKWLSTQEAMDYCRCAKDYFRENIKKSNEVVRFKKGRKDLYLLSSLDSWIEHHLAVTPQDAETWRQIHDGML